MRLFAVDGPFNVRLQSAPSRATGEDRRQAGLDEFRQLHDSRLRCSRRTDGGGCLIGGLSPLICLGMQPKEESAFRFVIAALRVSDERTVIIEGSRD